MKRKENQMKLLKYKLTLFEKVAAFQVLEQSTREPKYDTKDVECVTHPSICLMGEDESEFKEANRIYLRGTYCNHDSDVILVNFSTNDERDAFAAWCRKALEEWARGIVGAPYLPPLQESTYGDTRMFSYHQSQKFAATRILEYRLLPLRQSVAFQILEQISSSAEYDTKEVCCVEYPALVMNPKKGYRKIFLRGVNKTEDLEVSVLHFDNDNERDEYIDWCHKSIYTWVTNVHKHLISKDPLETSIEGDVVTLSSSTPLATPDYD